MAINIIKGSQKTITVRLSTKTPTGENGDPIDLTNAETLRACFPKSDGTKLYKARILKTGSITNASDVITVDTTDLVEGLPVSGTGIPSGATVLKVPTSTTSPSAPGTVQISANATATNAAVALTFGDITIMGDPVIGKISIPLDETETDSLASDTIDWELKMVILDVTSYVQFPASLNLIDRYC